MYQRSPPDLLPLVVDVAAELRRLHASGFVAKVEMLDKRWDELPPILQGPFGFSPGLGWELQQTEGFLQAAELLGLLDAAPPQESVKPRGRKRAARTSQDEAWLRRQLDGLGETGGA